MKNAYFLYLLSDPLTGEPRYVGITCQPSVRKREHFAGRTSPAVSQWVMSLKRRGLVPLYQERPALTLQNALNQEKRTIRILSSQGYDLLNVQGNTTPAFPKPTRKIPSRPFPSSRKKEVAR